MSYVLSGVSIKRPQKIDASNSTQFAQNRVMNGSVARDLFGSNKRVWILEYRNVQPTDYDTIKAVHDNYLSNGVEVSWESTETNNTISETFVHVDIPERRFDVGGETYLSNFSVILTEA